MELPPLFKDDSFIPTNSSAVQQQKRKGGCQYGKDVDRNTKKRAIGSQLLKDVNDDKEADLNRYNV